MFRPAAGDEFRDKVLFFEHFKGDGTQGVEFRKALGGASQAAQRDTYNPVNPVYPPTGAREVFNSLFGLFPLPRTLPGSGLEYRSR